MPMTDADPAIIARPFIDFPLVTRVAPPRMEQLYSMLPASVNFWVLIDPSSQRRILSAIPFTRLHRPDNRE
jgi:hypothetical protein